MTPLTTVHVTLSIALLAVFTASPVIATDIEVRIENLRSSEGHVRVALHQRVAEVDFPDDAGIVSATFSRAVAGSMRLVFTDLAPGDYAVAAFHDVDQDGELARNVLGMPTEGIGFSNGARGSMGPPSFNDAAVTVGPDEIGLSTTVRIEYPGK